ncbi:hypothetical protein [Dyadobacter frigoris]|uniref:Uncharacterized protein n=1 Tax=Dyadobacter frigoris TaxID=2576211 RepID=A0A4U6CTV3_9BACT|nr:hypothetical protein [Dyadobacter frigoris]TKT88120.1 hypothetical protein FDK13_27485 [Dyadobacter frigoris]GLU53733.1 hypothetical protein Dfri01_31940 [Dyadobacter frigoris]
MKKYILITLFCFVCIACDNKYEDMPKAQELVSNISYRKLTSVMVSGIPLSVTVLEINDSRCPINADCISVGKVIVKFSLSDGANNTEASIELINDEKDKTVQSFKLGDQSYSIKIHEVSPYPEIFKTINPEDYKVSLTIEKI